MNASILAFLTILPSIVNIVIMHKLRGPWYDDLYTDYGCKIQTVMIIQVVSILFATTFNYMYNNDSWKHFWYQSTLRHVIYSVSFNLTGYIIPMVTQLSALIFGYIRHKKSNQLERADYISYFDPVVEYYKFSYFALKK